MEMITPWLVKIPFPVADEVRKYRDDLIRTGMLPETKEANRLFYYDNPELKQYLFGEWNKTLHEHFTIGEYNGNFRLCVLVKNNETSSFEDPSALRKFHSHPHCVINTAMYLTPPKEPTLEIIDPDGTGEAEGCATKKISVEENYLYCMPNWLYHRIGNQQDERYRVCINMGYHSEGTAVLKQSSKHKNIWSSSWNVGM